MKFLKVSCILVLIIGFAHAQSGKPWTKEKANQWYANQNWLAGANFIPSTAINQLEMWQAESFDPATIDRELGWAEAIGMNTMRVYLHDLLWDKDSVGFVKRIDQFLQISQKHKIKPILVIFDSCWDPFPKLGVQRAPTPFVHNSGWIQSPGYDALKDAKQYPRLERYVKGLIRSFKDDKRILAWDVWNEPDNTNNSSYGKIELPKKIDYVLPLLKKTFEWARSANPSQPLTSGVWHGDWSSTEKMKPIDRLQLEESDIITFHNYDSGEEFEKRVKWLLPLGRPLICTEYMARGNNSTFKGSMPIAKKYNVGVINWGLVDGKTQTKYAWDSWGKKYTGEPPIWFHEIFHIDGKPYLTEEITLIKFFTAQAQEKPKPSDTEFYTPVPPIVTSGNVPSDAIILFDGKDLNEWVSVKDNGPAKWVVKDGTFTVDKSTGNIETKRKFTNYQLHIEWQIPATITGEGQGRGNSGLFLASTGGGDLGYELQILDSYNNKTYTNGQAGSIYKQTAPLVNANRKPGEWQSFDVIWTAPVFNEDGSLKSAARVSVLFNGVLIQNNFELKGPTQYIGQASYSKLHGACPIKLQSHGDKSEPISFRNIWIREL